MNTKTQQPKNSMLGKHVDYPKNYNPALLTPLPRITKRDEITLPNPAPFHGQDLWHAYELSWLATSGKPQVAMASFSFDCHSPYLIESKSFKLYLNSFNMSQWPKKEAVQQQLTQDLSAACGSSVSVDIQALSTQHQQPLVSIMPGQCLDELDVSCSRYSVHPDYLQTTNQQVNETLYSHLLKSNCLVTGQPDWGSMSIHYTGHRIDHAGLLRYLVSFRNHPEFHEQCVERCFWDIWQRCQPQELSVIAQYTRRGGLDINPYRSSNPNFKPELPRLVRQ